jgi:hypothetical protein
MHLGSLQIRQGIEFGHQRQVMGPLGANDINADFKMAELGYLAVHTQQLLPGFGDIVRTLIDQFKKNNMGNHSRAPLEKMTCFYITFT